MKIPSFMSWLRRFRAPPAVPTGTIATIKPDKKSKGISLQALMNLTSAVAPIKDTFVKYQMPELPPGVRPLVAPTRDTGLKLAHDEAPGMAFDDGGSLPLFGWLNGFNSFGCGMAFPGYPVLAELTQISEYRSPSETTSTEMTRKWIKIISKGSGDKADKITEIEKCMDEMKVRDMFRRAALLDGEFGRAQIIMNIKGQDDDDTRQLPLDISPQGVAKGSLLSLQCIEPYWSTPYSWNAMYPERADFYIPQSWYIMGRKTHSTRLLTFIGREVPDLLKPAYNFGGMSLTQLMQPYVTMWLRTRKSVNDLINNFSVTVLKTNLESTLQEGGDGMTLLKRIQLFIQTRGNQGLAAIDMTSEDIVKQDTSLASLDKLQSQSQEHMSAPCHIPLVKLFGVTPAGLNATSEGEIQVWYDFVRAMQENLYGPAIIILLKVIQLHLFGSIDDEISHEWVSLVEPSGKELAEIRGADATAGQGYVSAGVVSPDEERERLQNDPTSGYDNLNGPAPEPVVDPDVEFTAEAGAEQADAERQHSAEQADKQRDHDADTAARTAKAKTAA